MHASRALIPILLVLETLASPFLVSADDRDVHLARQFEKVNRSLETAQRVRVTTNEGRFVVSGVQVDSLGVHWSGVVDRGTLDSLRAPGTLTWGDVVGLDKRVSTWRRGAVAGAVLLGICTAVVSGAAVAVGNGNISPGSAAFIGGACGAGVGAALGGLITAPLHHWQKVYP